MTNLVEQKLIDTLVRQRTEFIELNLQSVLLQKKASALACSIDLGIPSENAGFLDCFDSVFHSISTALGESTKNRVRPKEASVKYKNESDLKAIITKVVDERLWDMLFNRLGLYKSMSKSQQLKFGAACRENPQPFTLQNVQATLQSMYENRESDLLDALFDTFTSLSSTYVSNEQRKFGNKIIIDNSFCEYRDSFALQSHESLEMLLTVVWRWILVNRWQIDETGVSTNKIWEHLSQSLENTDQDYNAIRSIESHGIEFRFFRKKTVHVLFPNSMIALLNGQLAKANALPSQ